MNEHLGKGSRSPVTTLGVAAAATGDAATTVGLKMGKFSTSAGINLSGSLSTNFSTSIMSLTFNV